MLKKSATISIAFVNVKKQNYLEKAGMILAFKIEFYYPFKDSCDSN
jgi:hypothetical protein